MKTVHDGTQENRRDAMFGERSASRSEVVKSGYFTARLTPQPKMIAAKERKERRDGKASLCVLCVPSRQKFARAAKTFKNSSSVLYARSWQRIRLPSPGGRIENSPRFQAWDCGRGTSRPEGTAEPLLHQWEQKQTRNVRRTRPSLRDLCNSESGPGSELPGYSRISLRETGIAGPKRPNTSASRSEAVKAAAGFSP